MFVYLMGRGACCRAEVADAALAEMEAVSERSHPTNNAVYTNAASYSEEDRDAIVTHYM